jgi:hypothetical protein
MVLLRENSISANDVPGLELSGFDERFEIEMNEA